MEIVLKKHFIKEAGVVLAVVSSFGAVALGVLAKYRPGDLFDVLVSREVQEDGGRRLLAFMQFISVFGTPYVALIMTLSVAGLFLVFSRRREAIFILFALSASVLNALIKVVIARPRPTDAFVTVYERLTDPSFPSGHVVFYVVFFGFLITVMFTIKNIPSLLRIVVVSLSAFLIGFISLSRIYLGVHWATDVLGGYCIGYLMLFILARFYFKNVEAAQQPADIKD